MNEENINQKQNNIKETENWKQENTRAVLSFWQKYKLWIIIGISLLIIIIIIIIVLLISVSKESKPLENVGTVSNKKQKQEQEIQKYPGILSLSPGQLEIKQGEKFKVDIIMNTKGYNIAVTEAILQYDPKKLEAMEINDSQSVMSMSAIKNIKDGLIDIVRGEPADGDFQDSDDGFTGENGILAQVIFKAKLSGKATVKFGKDSRMILDDGKGTGMEMKFGDGVYIIK